MHDARESAEEWRDYQACLYAVLIKRSLIRPDDPVISALKDDDGKSVKLAKLMIVSNTLPQELVAWEAKVVEAAKAAEAAKQPVGSDKFKNGIFRYQKLRELLQRC